LRPDSNPVLKFKGKEDGGGNQEGVGQNFTNKVM
jgi:hypothetical protein